MITIKDFMECVEYKITLADQDQQDRMTLAWDDMNPELNNARSVSITFNFLDQTVQGMDVIDGVNKLSFRWENVSIGDKFIGMPSLWVHKSFTHTAILLEEDILEKARAVFLNEPYDARALISFELPDDDVLKLMQQAKMKDLTLNDYIERLLQNEINGQKNDTNSKTNR